MRQVVLDTETTGLEPHLGHRIIEIGCVEVVSRRATGRHFHEYLNPERDIDAGAAAVHGMTREKLADKPRFAEVVERFLEFIDGAELVIHNAPFDVAFLDSELARWVAAAGGEPVLLRSRCRVLDTLALARKLHPGQRNSLDALAKRYSVDNSKRELHGALLDAQILAEIYLAMTGGQGSLSFDSRETAQVAAGGGPLKQHVDRRGIELLVQTATAEELAAHESMLKAMAKKREPLWRELEAVATAASDPGAAAAA